MALPAYLNFTSNIRTHAMFVGVMLTLDAIVTLLIRAAWNVKPEDLPKELQHVAHLKDVILGVGIVNAVFAIVFWVGFLKRQRWCLTVFIGFLAVAITLQFIGLLGAMLQLNFVSACAMLIVLGINGYVLLVTLQLRKVNSDFTLSQDGFSA
ncbi:uncharacterized protein LOC125771371 [Anopheles funestus]|uniref:uncharacterized protein LOC125771371 n=1 Tax=Anopheles funestus TaxID=62324 RepID=UPI0020C5FBFA|nr:uncharacterized protein LOC125771371 [Anopheles funestus]